MIPALPAGWNMKRLKFVARVQTGMAKGKDLAGTETVEVPYLRVANVQDGYLDLAEVTAMPVPVADLPRYRLKPGDVLMNEGGDFDKLGRGHVWHGQIDPCIHQNHVFAVRPHAVSPEWLNAYTESAPAQFYFMGQAKQSTNLASISSSNLMELPVPLPPEAVQRQLLALIDRETARINALIEKKTLSIELLREKRQALITQAVTRGLDRDTPLKDSGVDWLGLVPSHWRVMSLKQVVAIPITDGPHETPEACAEGVPFVSAEAVSTGRIDFGRIWGFISEEDDARFSKKYRPRRGDIFMVKSGATTGVTAIVDTDERFNIWSPLAVIRCGDKVLPEFMLNFMRSRNFQEAIALNWSFGTQQNIGMGVIGNLRVAVPPIEEQVAAVQQLDVWLSRIASLELATAKSVGLLRERRAALITAAVTGLIDVRTEVTEEQPEPV